MSQRERLLEVCEGLSGQHKTSNERSRWDTQYLNENRNFKNSDIVTVKT